MSYTNKLVAIDEPDRRDSKITAHFSWLEWSFCFITTIMVTIAAVEFFDKWSIHSQRIAWALAAAMISFAIATVGPIISLSRCGHSVVARVSVLSGIAIVLETVAFYATYFAFVGTDTASANLPVDKVLNMPPVIFAIWAAAVGWYVSYQASNKSQRKANAFALIMQTRTNTEFLKNLNLVRKLMPPPDELEETDLQFFASGSLKRHLTQLHDVKKANEVAGIDKARSELSRARLIEAIKYLLNFYEFVAVGVLWKDLDEDMLYETISPSIVSLIQRSAKFIEFVNGGETNKEKQVLAFQHCIRLANRWDNRLATESQALKHSLAARGKA